MPSILPGYEYDIFISYRQKDNKYDGWVTEFVENLKKELEATFKEEISVYFDINPHDGLLETHDVDEEEEEEELFEIEIDDKLYCTNDDENGEIWLLNDEGEPGEKVGYFKNGDCVFFEDE